VTRVRSAESAAKIAVAFGCNYYGFEVLGMPKRRLLYISSNHIAIRPGGLESYTHDLYEAFRGSDEFEPIFIARAGPPSTEPTCDHGWSPFAMVGDDPNQYLFYTNTFVDQSAYDPLFGRWNTKVSLTRFFRDFLVAQQPDVIHIHHTIFLGYDLIRVIKNTLPGVPIVYTLHEYVPICHRDGQMVRTIDQELCREESPRRCHECFPEISPQTFLARKRFIQSHLSLVDQFIAPSEYVRDRYVEWGLPADKVQVEPQGVVAVTDRLPEEAEPRPRNRFAFFGQLNPYKGADVLLEAMNILGPGFDGHLTIFGANLEIQPVEFRERFDALFDPEIGTVRFAGPYERRRLAGLMAGIDWVVVPSIWWETGPIVVVEAFQYGRPVICSDVGGMSEKVADGVNGLHFRRADPQALAETLRRAVETPGLWDELRAGVPANPGHPMPEHVAALSGVYRRLLATQSSADAPAALLEVPSA
jgi:glycosyltransferase involved in cell wall biosynthesis